MLLTTGQDPVLWLYNIDGTLSRKITVDLPRQPVTQKNKTAYEAQLDSTTTISVTTETGSFDVQSQRRELYYPEYEAFWDALTVDDVGYIWLHISWARQRLTGEPGTTYRVLSPEGEYLGITRAPADGRIIRRHLLAIVTDPETGEEVPTVWRISPAVRDFQYP